jgi:type I restriction enzyme S subunit
MQYTDKPLIASSEWIVVRNAGMDSNYLQWYFTSDNFRKLLTSQVAGIGGSLTRAQPKQVKTYNVPIPDIQQQRHIAAVLDKVNGLIDLRKQQIAKLDELVKARFVEMFNDKYTIVTADEVCDVIVDCPHSTPKYEGDNLVYPAIRTSEIKEGAIDWSSMKYVSYYEYLERTRRLVPVAGDIVYAREGTYGDCVVLPKGFDFCLGQRTMLFRPNVQQCTSAYLHQALRSDEVKRQADESNAGSTVPHVNVADAKKFKFPLPPMELQQQFAAFVAQVDKSKVVTQKALDETQTLFDSLMQKYFG